MRYQQEIFFRPAEHHRKQVTLSAKLYNRCRLLLNRAKSHCVFVPIRSMQFQAVICEDEIIFVDSQSYAVRNGQGGRMILLAWRTQQDKSRDSISEPVPIEVVHYHQDMGDTQRRLIGEFFNAACQVLERQSPQELSAHSMKVISIEQRPGADGG